MSNSRFSTAIHILTLLTHFTDKWASSEFIASSININAVIIRKELGFLQEAGFISTKKGKEGGAKLNKSSADITLADIYLLVKNTEVLGKKHAHPNPTCPIGNKINIVLDNLFASTDDLVLKYLSKQTLEDFAKLFH